jgi:N-acetyl-anhydromuramyl-L-alanine amidase AmpD
MTLSIDHSVASPNFNSRPAGVQPSGIVLHTTEGKWPSDLHWLASAKSQVSCHYVISPTGSIYQLVSDDKRAWHAGVGSFLGLSDFNDFSIGIECSHKSGDSWPEVQRTALKDLCRMLIAKYGIDTSRIVAHRWIAPDRRSDPTDWSDVALLAWINELVQPEYSALWGNLVPYFEASGIAATWRDNAAALGQATSDETTDKEGKVWRLFQTGAVSYSPATGKTVVYLPRGAK